MFKAGPLCASVVFVCGIVCGGIDSKSSGYQLSAAFARVGPFLGISFYRLPGAVNLAHMSLRRPGPTTGLHVNLCWQKAETGIMSDPNSSSLNLSSESMDVEEGGAVTVHSSRS